MTGATSSSRPRCGRNRRLLAKAPPVDVAPSRARGETRHRPGTAASACGAGHTDSETLGALWETHVTSSRALFSAATIAVLTSLHLNCHSPGPHVHGHEEPDAASEYAALHMDSAEGHTSKFSSTRFLTSQGGGYTRGGAAAVALVVARFAVRAHRGTLARIYIYIELGQSRVFAGVPDVLHNSRPAARHNWRVLGVAAAGRVRELREPALRTQRKPRPG